MYLEFKEERDEDFMNVYAEVVHGYGKKAPYIKKEALLAEAILSRAKRFYVSPEQAQRIVSRLLRGKTVVFKNDLKKEMYLTILERVKLLSQKEPDVPLSRIISDVIYMPAPRFYITVESASILFYQLLKR